MLRIVKKLLPILFLLAVWLVFSYSYFIQQKVPFASEYLVNFFSPWSVYEQFAGPVKNNAMPDVISQIYPWKKLVIDIWSSGQIPLWNIYELSGTPLLANYQSAALTPFNLLFFVFPFIHAWSLMVLFQPILAGFFMYLLARAFNRSKLASLFSSIAFMFCGFIVTWMGYATLGYAILFLPLALFSIEKYLLTSKKIYFILFSLSFPLSFFSGHFQISLYFFLFTFIYLVFKFFSQDKKKSIHLFLGLVLGIFLSAPQLLPSIEFYLQSFRSGIFQKLEAIPFSYLPTILAPDFYGNPVTRNDWFGHYAEWNGYIGVIPLILAVYSIFSKKNIQTTFLFILGIFFLLLAFDSPLVSLLVFLKIPVLSTSALSRIIVLFSFTFALLSSFGLDAIIADLKEKKFLKIFLFSLGFLAIFGFLWIIVFQNLFFAVDKIAIAKQNLYLPTLIFFAFFAIIILSLLFSKIKKGKFVYLLLVLLLFVSAFDLLRFAKKWQPFDPISLVYPEVKTSQQLQKVSSHERGYGGLGQEAHLYYQVAGIEGYDPLYIRRYGQFIASADTGKLKDSARSVVKLNKNGKYSNDVLNLLGVKYLIHKKSDGQNIWAFPFWKYPDQYILNYSDEEYEIYENKKALPKAFITASYKVLSDDQEIIRQTYQTKEGVVLEKDPGFQVSEDIAGKVSIVEYKNNSVEVNVQSDKKGILFLSDTFYPGWEVYVDGEKSELLRANYTFRAVVVNEGEHNVVFSYEPILFNIGIGLFLLGVLGVIFVPRILIPSASSFSLRSRKDK